MSARTASGMKKGLDLLSRRGDLAINNYRFGGVLKDGTVVNSNGKAINAGEPAMATLTKEEQGNRDRKEMGRWEAMRDRGAAIIRENARQERQAEKADKAAPREKSGPSQKA